MKSVFTNFDFVYLFFAVVFFAKKLYFRDLISPDKKILFKKI